jgi:hypothetical protein
MNPSDEELQTRQTRLAVIRARQLVRRYIPPDANLVDSLIEDRRQEAAAE